MRRCLSLALPLCLFACAARAPVPAWTVDPGLRADIDATIAALGPGVRAGVWLSPPLGEPLLAIAPDQPLPVASAIKAGYLVELFAAFPGGLDAPLPSAAAVFADDRHPAIAHFRPEQRQAASQALGKASVRAIGEAMITGKGVDNATYNIAANLVTAHFGGPVWLQAKLHERDLAWRGLAVRRYMLADRTANGDNEATARALAAVHGGLANGAIPGVDARAVAAARAVLARPDDAQGRHVFRKGGSLDSDPVTRVEAGWHEGPRGALVHVVMLAQDTVPAERRAAQGQALAAAARRIEDLLLAGAR